MYSEKNNIEKAIELALNAHSGQKDKAGSPHIFHCLRVMLKGKTQTEQIVGVLHDIIEDTSTSSDDLKKLGFSKEIIDAVVCLTKLQDEYNEDYIKRVMSSKLALKVKLYDLEDNLNLLRLKEISEKDIKRLNKYIKTYNMLISRITS